MLKVLKFGGSSVGSLQGLSNVKKIVESQDDQVLVIVSAFGDTTDDLIAISKIAEKGDASYQDKFNKMVEYHKSIISQLTLSSDKNTIPSKID